MHHKLSQLATRKMYKSLRNLFDSIVVKGSVRSKIEARHLGPRR